MPSDSDWKPKRKPIAIAGDLVRRDDSLSKEGANCIQELTDILRSWLDWRANKSTADLDEIAERAKQAMELPE